MKIGIFDPYLDTLGGGERYVAQIAKCLLSEHDISLFWDEKNILIGIKDRFGLDLSGVRVEKNIFSERTTFINRVLSSRNYDAIFYISDGSFPLLLSKSVFPILQFPLTPQSQSALKKKIKFNNIKAILCYSGFVKKSLEGMFPSDVKVVYPPVSIFGRKEGKENIILSVGRFTKENNRKNQEVLIDLFSSHRDEFKGWKLILAGGVLEDDEDFVENLKKKIKSDQIDIFPNTSYEKLVGFYQKAKIYWHAAGYGSDLQTSPKLAEHFGITCVEAMGAGCVPIVFSGGGLVEIIQDGVNGFTWENPKELLQKTQKMIESNESFKMMSSAAENRAKDFSVDKFCQEIDTLIRKK